MSNAAVLTTKAAAADKIQTQTGSGYLELLDVVVVLLERGADGLLEVVDQDEIREERQNVFDLE
jgi:hypothetical protein